MLEFAGNPRRHGEAGKVLTLVAGGAKTRHVATAESLEVVLQSIAAALVEQADATNSRIFLALTDDECPVCRSPGSGNSSAPTSERALHSRCTGGVGMTSSRGFAG
jgi:hypothetical protein